MILKREIQGTQIYQELNEENREYWFDFKQKKFLHNIDTFYYSVKLQEDFTDDSNDCNVLKLREFFDQKSGVLLYQHANSIPLFFSGCDSNLNLRRCTFAGFFTVCLECPEWFDIFLAPVVPHSTGGGLSVTCEMVVQIRSYMLWMYGPHEAFERSYAYVQSLCNYFDLHISFVQENRIDYCWHSNYLSNPEKFFAPDNFYKSKGIVLGRTL